MELQEMHAICQELEKFQRELPDIIHDSGRRKNYVMEKSGIDRKTFSRKVKRQSFKARELKKIIAALGVAPA